MRIANWASLETQRNFSPPASSRYDQPASHLKIHSSFEDVVASTAQKLCGPPKYAWTAGQQRARAVIFAASSQQTLQCRVRSGGSLKPTMVDHVSAGLGAAQSQRKTARLRIRCSCHIGEPPPGMRSRSVLSWAPGFVGIANATVVRPAMVNSATFESFSSKISRGCGVGLSPGPGSASNIKMAPSLRHFRDDFGVVVNPAKVLARGVVLHRIPAAGEAQA